MLFTELARGKSSIFWERSFEHPFIQGLVSGELAPEVFRYYLLQDRYYLEHFSKLYFLIAEKSASEEIQAHLRLNAEELKNGEIFVREGFFKELEIGEQEILETPVAPTAYHYVSHMYRQLIDGTVNSAIAGMLPCAWLYHELKGGRLTLCIKNGLKPMRVKKLPSKSQKSVILLIGFIKKVMNKSKNRCLRHFLLVVKWRLIFGKWLWS